MRRWKVVHVITMLELGGAQGNTLFTVRRLDRKRFDVALISGPGGVQDEEARKIPDLDLRFVPHLVRPIHPLKDFLALFDLVRILKEMKPDLVHTHSSKAGILGRIAARIAGCPVILHSIHGFGFNPYQNFLVRRLFIFLERRIASWTSRLIAVSNENIRQGLALGIGRREQYVLIRSGVDLAAIRERARRTDRAALRRKLGIPPDAKLVLSVGPFKVQKDPVSFVLCADRIRKEVPSTFFCWVGDGELRPQVEREIERLRMQDRFRLLGWRQDIPELLAACDLFLMTSLWEGLPRAAVEALIAGRPVVAFRVDGIPEVVVPGKNGFLSDPGDFDGLVLSASQVLKDAPLAQALGRNAAGSIHEPFDIHRMVRQQEELYGSLAPRLRS